MGIFHFRQSQFKLITRSSFRFGKGLDSPQGWTICGGPLGPAARSSRRNVRGRLPGPRGRFIRGYRTRGGKCRPQDSWSSETAEALRQLTALLLA